MTSNKYFDGNLLFHHSPKENRISINQEGIIRQFDKTGVCAVFLTDTPSFSENIDCWSVDVTGIKLELELIKDDGEKWWVCWVDIPPNKINSLVCAKQIRPTEDLKKDEAFDAEYDQARLDKQDLILRCGKAAVEKRITDPKAIGKMMEFMKYILHDAECQDHRYGKCDCQVKEALKIYNQAIGKL